MTSYEGKVQMGDQRLLRDAVLQAQLVGEYSDSGVFPLTLNDAKKVVSAFV